MSTLAADLRHRIAATGPIPFEEFMAACLYDPTHGYFATGDLRSVKAGDFLTSPEVSPWFGRIVGRHVAHVVSGLDEPRLVEVAAGSGSLLRPLLETVSPRPTVDVVEASPAARAVLAELVGADHVFDDISRLPTGLQGFVVANELLDNLPVALAVRAGRGWEERWVGIVGDELTLVPAPVRAEVEAWVDAHGGAVPEGGMVEVQLAASEWVAEAVAMLAEGAVVVFDYGGTAEELEPRRTTGTLRTYRGHHLGPDPLLAPGETDVTVDVNFTAMEAAAMSAGAEVTIERQDDYLRRWGLGDELKRLRRRELDLARSGDAMERLVVRSEITDAETLLHPRGLGDFRVMTVRVRR